MSHHKSTEALGHPPELVYRSLPILASYIILAAALALNACRSILNRYQARQKKNDWAHPARRWHFFLFVVLAALSLGATWYYMFAFFVHSYRNWEQTGGALELRGRELSLVYRLELWLQQTKLFREAWETVIETPARFWWSGQIFLWTTAWSLFLGVMARRYRIPHVWAYMLLGQIVAISFAQNLFFAAALASQQKSAQAKDEDEEEKRDYNIAWSPPLYLEVIPIAISLLSTVLVPTAAHTKYFMAILLVPHLLLFIPPTLRPSQTAGTAKPRNQASEEKTIRRYIVFFQVITAVCIALQAHATYSVLAGLGTSSYSSLARSLFTAVYEHPAVSSVSWDVVYCTVTAVAWIAVNNGSARQMLGGQ